MFVSFKHIDEAAPKLYFECVAMEFVRRIHPSISTRALLHIYLVFAIADKVDGIRILCTQSATFNYFGTNSYNVIITCYCRFSAFIWFFLHSDLQFCQLL